MLEERGCRKVLPLRFLALVVVDLLLDRNTRERERDESFSYGAKDIKKASF